MSLSRKVLFGMGALTLAAIAITGAVAAGRDHGAAAGCSKTECKRDCPKPCPKDCPPCPYCSSL